MTYASSLLVLAGIYLAVLASPGPNFFILSQMALQGRRAEARWVVLGLTTGSIVWVLVSLAGLSAVLASHPWAAAAVRLLGAAYLLWYGARLLASAFVPARAPREHARPVSGAGSRLAAWRTGLVTGLTNPKGAAFWTSAFATVLPAGAPPWFLAATVALVAVLSLGWHLGITLVFALPALRDRYLRLERVVNGVAGGALVVLGLQRVAGR
ncbi:LysE family transporter [Pseudorhodoferax sp. Leaf274]|uniref:LysE family transporter n=1 Tax=Pseudorhodoferax sp. Leaf274 TaxID=1736318 RepID=UPI0007026EAF|nr:LysE family transporter [Pseudorhodoferax sp. Leaf274]KQP49166.1 lysine transporter LysE [Pseudorhodoferax sp. Leaf274]